MDSTPLTPSLPTDCGRQLPMRRKDGISGGIENRFPPDHSQIRCRGRQGGAETRRTVEAAFNTIVANAKNYQSGCRNYRCTGSETGPQGEEVILGMNRYPVFGPLIMFGLGGIFVELFADVVFRLAPVNRNSVRRMIRQIKGFKLLDGFRGRPRIDLEEIEKSLVRLSDMVTTHPEIQELDINPLITHEKGRGATVADCRLVLKAIP